MEFDGEFVIEVNLKRHLDIIQKYELAEKIEEIEKEKAKIRKLSNLKQFKDTVEGESPTTEEGRAAGIIVTCESHGTEEAAKIAAK